MREREMRERDERERERQVIIVVALPNATVGQKAAVGQGLPNWRTLTAPDQTNG